MAKDNSDHPEPLEPSSGFKVAAKSVQEIEVPPEKPNKEYFDEYCKLYINNYILTEQLNGLKREHKELQEKLKTAEVIGYFTRKSELRSPTGPLRRCRTKPRRKSDAESEERKMRWSGPSSVQSRAATRPMGRLGSIGPKTV